MNNLFYGCIYDNLVVGFNMIFVGIFGCKVRNLYKSEVMERIWILLILFINGISGGYVNS